MAKYGASVLLGEVATGTKVAALIRTWMEAGAAERLASLDDLHKELRESRAMLTAALLSLAVTGCEYSSHSVLVLCSCAVRSGPRFLDSLAGEPAKVSR